ncbi:MAG: energy transducer TonB [Candidatus Acidiferrum sp.]
MMYGILLTLLLSLSSARSTQAPDQDKSAQPPAEEPRPKVTRVRMGGNVMTALLKKKVGPKYPREAREKGLQGTVRLHVIISKQGKVQQLEVVSGDPILAESASEAVRQWEYRPTLLNGQPVEVDTTVDVIFSFNP